MSVKEMMERGIITASNVKTEFKQVHLALYLMDWEGTIIKYKTSAEKTDKV